MILLVATIALLIIVIVVVMAQRNVGWIIAAPFMLAAAMEFLRL